ncbi:probable E3 ubiquitin-protein ligase ZFP1 [Durio zibethinus]|uniref:RING-type E3 ubiquitin transferase n=1 Tax=Durio zibethinus TaxID=66656 RepID=A0A6P5ZLV8_DURZI|nr:probable E3 ubiquitin-protein ligase ZFP1 [Durio zibethinus]XP_022753307.1 probable E3 ubiquitin-protein ligase ZFP1 [Durio zibethinus]XP_022753308.1 probable E3 ubiquitin-protein ligase ZFP1 [Durio zibethinus]
MGQRNMICPSQMINLEMDQRGQGYLHHEPCIFLGSITNYPPPDIQMAVTAPLNTTTLDTHPLPEHYDSSMFYAMPRYPGGQHHHHSPNLDLGIGSASNIYIPYVANPSSSVPVNHGPTDLMPSSSNYSLLGVFADEYAMNCHFMDNVRGSYKRKNSEGIPGNFQHFNASSSSSCLVAPLNTRPNGLGTVDVASFTIPQYRGNGLPPIREAGSQRSVRNRLGATAVDPVLMHGANHFFQGNYMDQPFQPTITDGGASAWTQAAGVPYMHGSNVGGPMDTRHRISSNFSHSSPRDLRNQNFQRPAPPIEGVRGHSINVHPQVAAVPYRFPASFASQSIMNPSQDMGRRQMGPVPPTGFRIYHSGRESGAAHETTLRHRNLPHLRVLPPDGVAVLEFPEFYEEVENFIDHHRDMRLDIEDMSYEELLALGERIGNVNTGLSDEIIISKLKTRTYSTFATNINLEEAAPIDQEPDSCIICQEDYKNQEKIGTLDCGHEYHAGCLRKWLLVKNVCPICKSEALATGSKNDI